MIEKRVLFRYPNQPRWAGQSKRFKRQSVSKLAPVPDQSLAEEDRIQGLLRETERELSRLLPEISALEAGLERLRTLRQRKQRLTALRESLQAVLKEYEAPPPVVEELAPETYHPFAPHKITPLKPSARARLTHPLPDIGSMMFIPDKAFQQVNHILRRRDSLNYELFRAVVLNGGRANTEQIRAFLIEQGIRQPATGQSFEAVPLTDISSRINYLVRKNIVTPLGNGTFVSQLGWEKAT